MTAPTRGQRRAVVLLLVVCALLVTVDHRGDSFAGARSVTRSVFDPVQRGMSAMVAPVGRTSRCVECQRLGSLSRM